MWYELKRAHARACAHIEPPIDLEILQHSLIMCTSDTLCVFVSLLCAESMEASLWHPVYHQIYLWPYNVNILLLIWEINILYQPRNIYFLILYWDFMCCYDIKRQTCVSIYWFTEGFYHHLKVFIRFHLYLISIVLDSRWNAKFPMFVIMSTLYVQLISICIGNGTQFSLWNLVNTEAIMSKQWSGGTGRLQWWPDRP